MLGSIELTEASLVANYLCFLLIAVTLFGAEFKHQTMARLLAQPISRSRLWGEKTLSFFTIILMVIAFQGIAFGILLKTLDPLSYARAFRRFDSLLSFFLLTGFWLGPVALASGVLASLWLRQIHTAFWAALVLPPATLMACFGVDQFLVQPVLHVSPLGWLVYCALALFGRETDRTIVFYAACAFWFCVLYPLAWLKFKRLEV